MLYHHVFEVPYLDAEKNQKNAAAILTMEDDYRITLRYLVAKRSPVLARGELKKVTDEILIRLPKLRKNITLIDAALTEDGGVLTLVYGDGNKYYAASITLHNFSAIYGMGANFVISLENPWQIVELTIGLPTACCVTVLDKQVFLIVGGTQGLNFISITSETMQMRATIPCVVRKLCLDPEKIRLFILSTKEIYFYNLLALLAPAKALSTSALSTVLTLVLSPFHTAEPENWIPLLPDRVPQDCTLAITEDYIIYSSEGQTVVHARAGIIGLPKPEIILPFFFSASAYARKRNLIKLVSLINFSTQDKTHTTPLIMWGHKLDDEPYKFANFQQHPLDHCQEIKNVGSTGISNAIKGIATLAIDGGTYEILGKHNEAVYVYYQRFATINTKLLHPAIPLELHSA